MKIILYCLLMSFVLLPFKNPAQTPISGIVNQYTAITGLDQDCKSLLTVDDTTGFQAGAPILIIQMQGAIISTDDNSDFGTVTDMRNAGRYERAIIDSVAQNELYLQQLLVNDYDVDGSIQVVSIPVYQEAEVVGPLTAKAWDGSTGGVLMIKVEGRLTMSDDISVNGLGFRGGEAVTNLPNDCQWFVQHNDHYYSLDNWRGSAKGEGVAKFTPGREAGRGPQANGGGGGNDHNSGGGGGAHLAVGGQGGENDEPSTFGCKGRNPGLGGRALSLSNGERLFMGGGGGAGHGNNNNSTNGGNGGGIVIIDAGILNADLDFINSRGAHSLNAEGDGAGGGGAGGTIMLQLGSIEGFVNLNSEGGSGGNSTSNQNRCFGPGGGGSGGVAYMNQNFSVVNYTNNPFGGQNGESFTPNCNSANGATPGSDSGFLPILFDSIPQSIQSLSDFSIAQQPQSQSICLGDGLSFQLQANGNNLSYQWQLNNGGGFQNLSNNATYSGTQGPALMIAATDNSFATHNYRCLIDSDCANDIPSAVVDIQIIPEPQLLLPPEDLVICEGRDTFLQLLAQGIQLNYQWQRDIGGGFMDLMNNADFSGTNTELLQINDPNTDATFRCIITDSCGIALTAGPAFLQITSLPLADFDFVQNGGTLSFNNLSSNGNTYVWNFGDTNGSTMRDPVHTYSQDGVYTITLEVTNDCGTTTYTETVSIELAVAPTAAFSVDDGSGCAPLVVQFSDESGSTVDSRMWTFEGGSPASSTAANPVVTYNDAGLFDVRLEVSNSAGSNQLLQESYIRVELQPKADFSFEQNEFTVSFTNLSTDAAYYQWNFDDGSAISTEENPVHVFPGNGVYNVTLFATNDLCGAAITIPVVISIVSTSEVSKAPFEIFPNPFIGGFSLKMDIRDLAELQIYNVLGQTVPFTKDQGQVQLLRPESGIYYVVITDREENRWVKKLLCANP